MLPASQSSRWLICPNNNSRVPAMLPVWGVQKGDRISEIDPRGTGPKVLC